MLVSGIKAGETGGGKSEVDVMTESHLPNIAQWPVPYRTTVGTYMLIF